jgi:hypothetical protein
MRFKIHAGGELDIPSAKEIRAEVDGAMSSWAAEIGRGDKYRRFSVFGTIAGGLLSIGDQSTERVGPEAGFVWSVKRLALYNYNPDTEGNELNLYVSSPNASALVMPAMDNYNSFDANQLVLYGGETLYVDGTHVGDGKVWLTGQARELPVGLVWRL